jgi:hypothetical protein
MKRLAALALVVVAACSSSERPAPGGLAATLPPFQSLDTINAIYGKRLAALGLRMTRAARYEENPDTHVPFSPSPAGTHLALYAEPADTFTTGRFLNNIVPLTKLFAPDVFRRWPGLTSFDICQEPIQAASEEQEAPVPVTQVRMTKEQALAMDWETLDLAGIVRAARADPPGLSAFFVRRIRAHPDYDVAFDEATPGPD